MNTRFQESVAKFVKQYDLEIDITSRLLDLVSENGELAKEVLKSTKYGKVEFLPTEDWEGELGDIFFSLVCLANTTGVNLEDALNKVLRKYEDRIKSKQEAGSGR